MKLELQDINVLPIRTWSWLNVNSISLNEDIPDLAPFNKETITHTGAESLFVAPNGDFDKLLELETGIGKNYTEFVLENKNKEVTLFIPENKKIEEPIIINYEFDNDNLVAVDLNRIIAEAGSEVNVVLNYKSSGDEAAFHAGLTFIEAKENAVVNISIIQTLNDNSIHMSDVGTMIHENAVINVALAEVGGKKAIKGYKSILRGNESKQFIDAIYFGDKSRFIDINYLAVHEGKFVESNLQLHGALLDESRKCFRGTIDFRKGCAGAIGEEVEYNLLFSPKVKNLTAPLILCGEENVQGMHGANSGKVQEDQLFYMMSRGIDELTAKKIIIEASFAPAIDKIPVEDIQNEIIEFVKGRLLGVKQI